MDAIDDFKSGKLDEIYIVYTKIQNALTSEPVMERLLPLDRAHLTPAPKGLGDPRGEVEMFRMPGRCSSRRPPSICTA